MSRIPNCREDEYYNEKYLTKEDKKVILGYDIAVEESRGIITNLEIYDFDIEGEDINLAKFLENHPKIADRLEDAIADYLEMQRDELITAMIDDMTDEEYERIKAEVDSADLDTANSTQSE